MGDRLLVRWLVGGIGVGLCAVVVFRFADSPALLAWCWMCLAALPLAVVDLEQRRLPTRLVALFAGGGLLLLAAAAARGQSWNCLISAAASAIGVFVIATVVQIMAPAHTGGGDTKLYGALALYLGWWGWPGLVMGLLFATAFTAVAAVVVLMNGGRLDTKFPAGPTLILGSVIGVLVV